jgi:hypothetical protein
MISLTATLISINEIDVGVGKEKTVRRLEPSTTPCNLIVAGNSSGRLALLSVTGNHSPLGILVSA